MTSLYVVVAPRKEAQHFVSREMIAIGDLGLGQSCIGKASVIGCHGALMIITQLEQASSYVGSIAWCLPRSAHYGFLWLENVRVDTQTFSTKTVCIFPTSRKSVRIFGPTRMFSQVGTDGR